MRKKITLGTKVICPRAKGQNFGGCLYTCAFEPTFLYHVIGYTDKKTTYILAHAFSGPHKFEFTPIVLQLRYLTNADVTYGGILPEFGEYWILFELRRLQEQLIVVY